uniref:Ubiquitin-like protein 3 n=1 Tax=Neogobius melanostomus TaxID=47308 RepID=A0A8C6UBT2_9GOBI
MTSPRDQDMVHLRLILVSGKTQDFTFSPNDSATDIAKHVFENWPAGWDEERVSSPSILRLIFQGRFLHGNVTLGALKLPPGRTTVMHLVARETLPEPNSHGENDCLFVHLVGTVHVNEHNIVPHSHTHCHWSWPIVHVFSGRGSWSTRRKPTQTWREHSNSTQKGPRPGGNRAWDLLAVKHEC